MSEKTVQKPNAEDPYEMIEVRFPREGKDNPDVFIGHNGKAYIAKRGVPVKLPRCVYQVYLDAMRQQEAVDRFNDEHAS